MCKEKYVKKGDYYYRVFDDGIENKTPHKIVEIDGEKWYCPVGGIIEKIIDNCMENKNYKNNFQKTIDN